MKCWGAASVPVPLLGRGVDDVARTDGVDRLAPRLDPSLTLGHVEGLAGAVGVPGAAGAGVEVDGADIGVGRAVGTSDRIHPDLAGEPLQWGSGRWLFWS